MEKQILQEILGFMEKAGAFALENQATAQNELKADNSIVTETDLAISKMAHQMFAHWLEKEDHVLIDEESIDQIGTPEEVFANSTYQWVLDPIDGTANYACGRHNFGIMLAVLKNGGPFVAAMYQPKLGELVYGSLESGVMHAEKGFSSNTKNKKITSVAAREMHSQCYFDITKSYMARVDWDCMMWPNTPACAIQGSMDTVLGRNSGSLISKQNSIWDMAPQWSFFSMLGADVFKFERKKIIKNFNASLFRENWKLSEAWLFAQKNTLNTLHNHLESKEN